MKSNLVKIAFDNSALPLWCCIWQNLTNTTNIQYKICENGKRLHTAEKSKWSLEQLTDLIKRRFEEM